MLEFPQPDPDLAHLAGRNLIYKVGRTGAGRRLDIYTAGASGLSRGRVRDLIGFGSVWVRGRVCRRQSRILQPEDWVTLQVPFYGPVRFYEADPARVLFYDDWLLAYDKEAGLPSQQTPYDGYNNLFAALVRLRGSGYLALHHRLDRLTSGVMVFSLSREANRPLSRLFSQGLMTKTYLALVHGRPVRDSWQVDRPIAKQKGGYFCPPDGRGRPARTEFTVLARGRDRTLVQARPLTGRTHQIRLHLAWCGHPVLGDPAYQGPPAPRLMLHAAGLSFEHPLTGRPLNIESSAPVGFGPEDVDKYVQTPMATLDKVSK